jgi:outer membrane autotransporter protein
LNAIAQAGADRYHINRRVDLASGSVALTSGSKGSSRSADAEAGHRFDVRGVAVIPSVGMAYDTVDRDALGERGDDIARLTFGDANRQALQGRASIRLNTRVRLGTMAILPYAVATVTHEFDDRSTVLPAGLAGDRLPRRRSDRRSDRAPDRSWGGAGGVEVGQSAGQLPPQPAG